MTVNVTRAAAIAGNIDPDHLITAAQGFHMEYGLELVANGTDRYFRVNRIGAHPHSRTFVEGRLASFSFMNQGTDFIAGQGIASALSAATGNPEDWGIFTTASTLNTQYATSNGSDGKIEYDGISTLYGVAKTLALYDGDFLMGGFFEMGMANLGATNKFQTVNDIHTNGSGTYYGGGVLGRYDSSLGIYAEAFVRAGVLESEYDIADIRFATEHKNFTPYLSSGLNLGYQLANTSKSQMLDLYSRYSFALLQSEDATIDDMDYQFETIMSHQVRLGARYTYSPNDFISPYIGAAWQYEFDGDANAVVRDQYKLTSPSLTGNTGVFEIGTNLSAPNAPVSLNLSVEGYVGQREGMAGVCRLVYTF